VAVDTVDVAALVVDVCVWVTEVVLGTVVVELVVLVEVEVESVLVEVDVDEPEVVVVPEFATGIFHILPPALSV
jgi:hypothetical protein